VWPLPAATATLLMAVRPPGVNMPGAPRGWSLVRVTSASSIPKTLPTAVHPLLIIWVLPAVVLSVATWAKAVCPLSAAVTLMSGPSAVSGQARRQYWHRTEHLIGPGGSQMTQIRSNVSRAGLGELQNRPNRVWLEITPDQSPMAK